jgi:hypothetical protein
MGGMVSRLRHPMPGLLQSPSVFNDWGNEAIRFNPEERNGDGS